MCRHHSTLSSAPVRIPVLRVPAAGILDGTIAKVTHDLGTLVQTVGEERMALIAEATKPALDPRRVAGVHPQALLALDCHEVVAPAPSYSMMSPALYMSLKPMD